MGGGWLGTRSRWGAALLMAGAMLPMAAQAQMGPRPVMGPGMHVRGLAASARTLGAERTGALAPSARGQAVLAALGVALSVGGVAGYQAFRSRARRRCGPATILTEAVLVVDLVDSTRLATHWGDHLAMAARTLVKDRALAAAEPNGPAFVENTGDGCLMTFPSVAGAVRTAVTLLQDLRQRPSELSRRAPLDLRVGISYGEILLDGRDGRHGAVLNRAFRLERLTRGSFVQLEASGASPEIRDRNRIFLDEEAAGELAARKGVSPRFVGYAALKGFAGLHGVYEVSWEVPARALVA